MNYINSTLSEKMKKNIDIVQYKYIVYVWFTKYKLNSNVKGCIYWC